MSANSDEDARIVTAAIVRYLRAHRDAADTVDGVARWWLGRQSQRETVEHAMAMLVERRVAERHTLPDGTVVFRRGPRLIAR
jgi:hypothetical protein